MKKIDQAILPKLAASATFEIAKDINQNHFFKTTDRWAGSISVVLLIPTAILLYRSDPHPTLWLLMLWSLGWWLLFYVAARAVIVGCFYYYLAKHIFSGSEQLFWPNPADTALVRNVSSVGRTMMLFWFGIALSIIFVVPFACADLGEIAK